MCQTRAGGLGLKVEVSPEEAFTFGKDVCGALLQYPATDGTIHHYQVPRPPLCNRLDARCGRQGGVILESAQYQGIPGYQSSLTQGGCHVCVDCYDTPIYAELHNLWGR